MKICHCILGRTGACEHCVNNNFDFGIFYETYVKYEIKQTTEGTTIKQDDCLDIFKEMFDEWDYNNNRPIYKKIVETTKSDSTNE